MRYGHSAGGIIGITLKSDALKIWALSRHICCKIESDMMDMEDEETSHSRMQLYHKEEGNARIEADEKDRSGLRQKLTNCIHPLDPNGHPTERLLNFVTGKVSPPSVNVESAVSIGQAAMTKFESTWPGGFYNTIPKNAETMAATCKSVRVGESKVYDLNSIYTRVIALLCSERDVDVREVLSHELAPVPTSMFTQEGMRICTNKSMLKKLLQVEVSGRTACGADVMVIDGSALLWTIHWPADGTVADFIGNVRDRLRQTD